MSINQESFDDDNISDVSLKAKIPSDFVNLIFTNSIYEFFLVEISKEFFYKSIYKSGK